MHVQRSRLNLRVDGRRLVVCVAVASSLFVGSGGGTSGPIPGNRTGVQTATNVCVSYHVNFFFQGAVVKFPAVVRYRYTSAVVPGPAELGLPNRPFIRVDFLGISPIPPPPDGCAFPL